DHARAASRGSVGLRAVSHHAHRGYPRPAPAPEVRAGPRASRLHPHRSRAGLSLRRVGVRFWECRTSERGDDMSANAEDLAKRTPPGQVLTTKWPVLTYGLTPKFNPKTWTFRCFGLVEEEVSWTWEEFLALPRITVVSDIHCVTHWSRYDNRWEGVPVREILARVRPKAGAVAVMAHTQEGYTTNVPIEDLKADDALLRSEE